MVETKATNDDQILECDVPEGPSRCRGHLNATPPQTGSRPEAGSTGWRSTWTGWRAPEETEYPQCNEMLALL